MLHTRSSKSTKEKEVLGSFHSFLDRLCVESSQVEFDKYGTVLRYIVEYHQEFCNILHHPQNFSIVVDVLLCLPKACHQCLT